MIEALLDFEGSFATFREAFGVDDDRPWPLRIHAFRAGTVLVDAGVGPPGEDPFMPERDGRLLSLVDPDEIELVVFTHLHPDHVGWSMRDGRPVFPNARHVAHRLDHDFFTRVGRNRPYVREKIVPLDLELVEDGAEPLPGVRVRHAPGHTPGHCVVELDDAVVLGDLAVAELQLADPDLAYASEVDSAQAATTRRRILEEVAGRTVGISHLGVGQVEAAGKGFRWVASK